MKLPAQIMKSVEARLGGASNVDVSERSSRRGVTTFDASRGERRIIIKLASSTDDGHEGDIDSIRREGAVLAAIETLANRFHPEICDGESVALIEQYFEGQPAFSEIRTQLLEGKERLVLELMRLTFGALAELHVEGWAHGDLQPGHFLRLGPDDVVMLDYGQAQSTRMPMKDYRGGMVHFNAPEVCRDILDGTAPIATATADVFSMGSVFAFSILGRVFGNYDNRSASYEDACSIIGSGNLLYSELKSSLSTSSHITSVLLSCTEIDVLRRSQSAPAVLDLIDDHLEDLP